jgi:branched-chain amino acid aminotransferase
MNSSTDRYYLLNNILKSEDDLNTDESSEGLSVYEIVRVKDGMAIFLEDHLRRLYHSLELEKLNINEKEQDLKEQVGELITNNPVSEGKIKFVVSFYRHPQSKEYNLWLYYNHYEPPKPHQYKKGVDTILCRAVRNDPNVKMLNTEARLTADRKIHESSVYEAILVDEDGYVTEGSRSNVFFISGHTVVTAPDEVVLQGIARGKILEICHEHHLDLRLQSVHRDELKSFDTAFLSGTTPKILPVRRMDETVFSVENPLLGFLMEAYDGKINQYIKNRKSQE